MSLSPAQKEYYSFIEEYTGFLESMLADEKGKLLALQSRDLSKIEHSIAVSQANAKQLENYEVKRVSMQAKAGYGSLSFRQIIESFPKEIQSPFWQLYDRFERSVGEIRFHNDKSMAVARDNMLALDPSAVLPGAGAGSGEGQSTNPYKKFREEQDGQSSILETKI
ncbi:hypothetical protein LJC49_01530 [Ruminococcaceae bacterium OttesenSCG-928-I18]|nr:hypothetical protein [Ruminococcaceae bacterium OttesenSCG-928-I18]